MTLAEFLPKMRAMMTNAEAEAPEVTADSRPTRTRTASGCLPSRRRVSRPSLTLSWRLWQRNSRPTHRQRNRHPLRPHRQRHRFRRGSRQAHRPIRRRIPRACCSD